MFSFVDIRVALLLSAAVLLARGLSEEDGKYNFHTAQFLQKKRLGDNHIQSNEIFPLKIKLDLFAGKKAAVEKIAKV